MPESPERRKAAPSWTSSARRDFTTRCCSGLPGTPVARTRASWRRRSVRRGKQSTLAAKLHLCFELSAVVIAGDGPTPASGPSLGTVRSGSSVLEQGRARTCPRSAAWPGAHVLSAWIAPRGCSTDRSALQDASTSGGPAGRTGGRRRGQARRDQGADALDAFLPDAALITCDGKRRASTATGRCETGEACDGLAIRAIKWGNRNRRDRTGATNRRR